MPLPVLLFDVNETLLDTSALDPPFARAFGAASARRHWFLVLEELWMTAAITGAYQPFDKLARAALEMTAARESRHLDAAARGAILDGLQALPPHAEAPAALDELGAAGIRLAALTNSTLRSATNQLRHADLAQFLETIFSAEQVKRYKPAPEPYLHAARKLGVQPAMLYLVSAHAWDISGADAAGLHTVFVRRPGAAASPVGPKPDIEVADLAQLARNIVDRRARRKR